MSGNTISPGLAPPHLVWYCLDGMHHEAIEAAVVRHGDVQQALLLEARGVLTPEEADAIIANQRSSVQVAEGVKQAMGVAEQAGWDLERAAMAARLTLRTAMELGLDEGLPLNAGHPDLGPTVVAAHILDSLEQTPYSTTILGVRARQAYHSRHNL